MPLNDIIMVFGNEHIDMKSYNQKKMDFDLGHCFSRVHNGQIKDGVFAGDNVYSVSQESNYVYQIRLRDLNSYQIEKAQQSKQWALEEEKKSKNLENAMKNLGEDKNYKSLSLVQVSQDKKNEHQNLMEPMHPDDKRSLLEKAKDAMKNAKSNGKEEIVGRDRNNSKIENLSAFKFNK